MKSHEEISLQICFFCLRKGDRSLQTSHIDFIERHRFSSYRIFQDILPAGSCGTCRNVISAINKSGNDSKRSFPQVDYENLVQKLQRVPPVTRQNPVCQCFQCITFRSTFVNLGARPKPKLGRPSLVPEPAASGPFCTKCEQELKPGRPHSCSRVEHVTNLMKRLTPKTRQELASETIKEQIAKAGTSSTNVSLPQVQGGRLLNVSIGASSVKGSSPISTDFFLNLQRQKDLTNTAVLDLARSLKKRKGRKFIAPGLKQSLIESGKLLIDFFECKKIDLEIRDTNTDKLVKVSKDVVLCKSVPEFIAFFMQERNLQDNNVKMKVGVDGGGGALHGGGGWLLRLERKAEEAGSETKGGRCPGWKVPKR